MTVSIIKYASLILISANMGYSDDIPRHIVQPLPKELDPRVQAPFSADKNIVRPLNSKEIEEHVQGSTAPINEQTILESAKASIAAHLKEDKAVDVSISEFRRINQISINTTASTPIPDGAKTSDPDTYQVNCADGVYFDMEQGLLVYMKNVSLRNPRMSLDCTGPLKIYLTKKAPTEKSEKAAQETKKSNPVLPNGGNFNFDSLKKVSASGNVVIHYTDEKGTKNKATAEIATYDATKGEILLIGGYPTISSDGNVVRCPSKDGFIRIYGNGNVYVSHGAETILRDIDKQISTKNN